MKEPLIYLEHIIESILSVEEYTRNVTKGHFYESPQLQDSVIRRIEIIGEAVKNLPERLKHKYSDIPWKLIAGMRDKLVHEYFSIDLELTWRVVTDDLPKLKKNILRIIKELKQ